MQSQQFQQMCMNEKLKWMGNKILFHLHGKGYKSTSKCSDHILGEILSLEQNLEEKYISAIVETVKVWSLYLNVKNGQKL